MLNISKNRCVGCGICEKMCPNGAIQVDIRNGLAVVDDMKCIKCLICINNCPQHAIEDVQGTLIFAIGTDDERTIKADDHFGMSKYFQIWSYSDGEMKYFETRINIKIEEDETRIHGDPKKAKSVGSVLKGVDVILGKMFGANFQRLKNKYVPAVTRELMIDNSISIIKENINEIIEEYEKKERKGVILN